MVNATVDNEPVSIQLDSGQSTTVPSNETWKVQLTLSVKNTNNGRKGSVDVNSVSVIGALDSNESAGQVAPSTVLVGDDTVSLDGAIGASITGFVVDS